MNDAAFERNVSIQYCLPSATDMLVSLSLPAVVQARASGDYARPEVCVCACVRRGGRVGVRGVG